MSFKSGFVAGLGVGYVLGARAGRSRYEQIKTKWAQLSGSQAVQQAADKTRSVAAEQGKHALSVVQHGVEKAGSAVKDRLTKDDGGSDTDPWRGNTVPDTVEGQLP